MRDIQETVAKFVASHGLESSVQARLLDLASEVGELAKEYLSGSRYGRDAFRASPEWPAEVGDVLFSIVCVANGSGVDLESALGDAMEKYRRRLSDRGHPGSQD